MELPGAPNYKYYGAAKNLPGVRELFAELEESAEKKRLLRSRGDVKRTLNAEYYGFQGGCCEDDPALLQKEKEREVRV
jgi:pre-mRNA-splicing factor ISY1